MLSIRKIQNLSVTLTNKIPVMNFVKSVGQNLAAGVTSAFLEKPEYTVTANAQLYEERDYEESVWVSTKVMSMTRKPAVSSGFWKLFKYIQGENVQGKKIDMTAPVAVKIEPGAGPNCESTFTVSFYVGKAHWAQPPKPTNEEVFLERWPRMGVYCRQFGGFAEEETWLEEAKKLSNAVKHKTDFDQEYYFTAGYDAPFKLFNRTNELWFIKKEHLYT